MAGLPGIDAKRVRQTHGHSIKALDQTDRIGFRLIWGKRWKNPGRGLRPGREQRSALAAQVCRQAPHAIGCSIGGHEHQDRIARGDQRHRPMQELGPAERLRMKIAGFLKLERCLACNRKRWPSPNGYEARRAGKSAYRAAPIQAGGRGEPVRQSRQRRIRVRDFLPTPT